MKEQATNHTLKISQFKKVRNKKDGIINSFVATKGEKTYTIKEFKNRNLTEDELSARIIRLKKSFRLSQKQVCKVIFPDLEDQQIDTLVELGFKPVEENIIEDDLNIAYCIREYLAEPIYKALINEDAPNIFLVEDDQDKGKIYLASESIPNFTTVLDQLNKEQTQYKTATGYERILAAQFLAGESDIIQPGNYRIVEDKQRNLHFAKIDHGRTFYRRKNDFFTEALGLLCVRGLGIKISTSKLKSELKRQAIILKKNGKLIECQISERVKNLEKNLNKGITFKLCTVNQSNKIAITEFHYDESKKQFVSDSGKTLKDYFISEFRRYNDRANFLNTYINKAINGCFVMIILASGIFLAKFFEAEIVEKLGEKSQKAILGISITLLCSSALYMAYYLFYHFISPIVMDGVFDILFKKFPEAILHTLKSTEANPYIPTDTQIILEKCEELLAIDPETLLEDECEANLLSAAYKCNIDTQ